MMLIPVSHNSISTVTSGFSSPTTTIITTTVTTSTTTTSSFTSNLKPLTSPKISTVPNSITPVASTSTVNSVVTPLMTYHKLESLINQWNLELEDHEKHFLHHATRVNAWDHTLIDNGDKIITLHGEVEKVKLYQKRLETELDFILSQHSELENLLIPLEESVKDESGLGNLQHADMQHDWTYKLAENIDAQLKHISQDLKDFIGHLNAFESPTDTTDPIQQICKFLNGQIESLQQIDQNSGLLQRKVEEITQVFQDYHRSENYYNKRTAFD